MPKAASPSDKLQGDGRRAIANSTLPTVRAETQSCTWCGMSQHETTKTNECKFWNSEGPDLYAIAQCEAKGGKPFQFFEKGCTQ